jgi:hypothetical protein
VTALHSFAGKPDFPGGCLSRQLDGSYPQFGKWIQASDGNFYGSPNGGGRRGKRRHDFQDKFLGKLDDASFFYRR